MSLATFIQASAHSLPMIEDGSVQAVICSPPYYGLRVYAGEQGIEWPAVTYRLNEWVEPTTVEPMTCGLGMESSPVAYIGHLILCLREWRRVLRADGTCWVNLGDSYAGGGGFSAGAPSSTTSKSGRYGLTGALKAGGVPVGNLKPKDLLMIPALFAIAARADGWWLRSDIVWSKPNPMPESVRDRCTKAHEYIFLLAKSPRYFWDAEAVKEGSVDPEGSARRYAMPFYVGEKETSGGGRPNAASNTAGMKEFSGTRNLRSVWHVATQPTPYAHFATWPEKLVEPMVKAGSSERGCCPTCGAPWQRVTETQRSGHLANGNRPAADERGVSQTSGLRGNGRDYRVETNTLGWRPSCACPEHEPVPCTVLDPFNGSGTTGRCAVRLGRKYIGVDIAAEYLDGVTAERFGEGIQMEITL